jgi:ABC-type phosphate transport system permease subunit
LTRLGGRVLMGSLVVAAALAGLPPRAAAADDKPTFRIDPLGQTVSAGQTVTVRVVQSASAPTTGAQISLIFDEKLLQLNDFQLASGYTAVSAIFQFGNADKGTNGNKDAEIKAANEDGELENVAAFLLPGGGVIPAGENPFLELTFVARSGDGGDVTLYPFEASMIDESGQPLAAPALVNGVVTVQAGTAPPPSPGSSASPSPSSGPNESAAAELPLPSPSSPTTPVTVSVAPTSLDLVAGNSARIFMVVKADGDISSVSTDLHFDPAALEITAIEPGPGWSDGSLLVGGQGTGVDAAIAEANASGVLTSLGPFFPPGTQEFPYGESWYASVLVTARTSGTSSISVGNATVLGIVGEPLQVTIDTTSLAKPPDKGIDLDPTIVVPIVLLLIVVAVFGVQLRTGRIPVRVRRRWPYYVSLLLGLIPVVLFTALIVMLVVNAAPVIESPGVGALFGGDFIDPKGNVSRGYGLLEPLWGTILISAIAVAIALPVSLALAVVAVDFPMGPVGRIVRPVIGVLSGVPPIVYAVSVPVFVATIMIPKFAGNMTFDTFDAAAIGADPATWPPPGVPFSPGAYSWSGFGPSSTMMGGLLVGLFLIPFVTPLFVDALRNVPRAAREASLALGANRTYTLRRVVIPEALPALVSGSILAVLKAMGDAVIVLFAVGTAAAMPTPAFDALERATGLAACGAALIGSFEVLDATCSPQACAVGYTSALVLMVVAGIAVVVLSSLQARSRRGPARPAPATPRVPRIEWRRAVGTAKEWVTK